jgi:hypothetical protein
MRTRGLFLQACLFTISSLTLLFLLSVVVHFRQGRLLFAILVSGICLVAECFAFFKVTQLLWRVSGNAALSILRIGRPGQSSRAFLTEPKN